MTRSEKGRAYGTDEQAHLIYNTALINSCLANFSKALASTLLLSDLSPVMHRRITSALAELSKQLGIFLKFNMVTIAECTPMYLLNETLRGGIITEITFRRAPGELLPDYFYTVLHEDGTLSVVAQADISIDEYIVKNESSREELKHIIESKLRQEGL